jgi:pre-mRNA-splicing factor RBM22/SLT11
MSAADKMAAAAARPGATLAQTPDGLRLGEDFPFICEVCLGPNPYLRMIKMPMARECKISGRPYTAFRWQPGAEARYKETIIAAEVAIAKNVCQVCLMDMEYNLPVAVRDKLMSQGGGGGGSSADGAIAEPSSDVNKEFYWENQKRMLEEGTLQGYHAGGAGGAGGKMVGQSFEKLAALSRNTSSTPYYDRNLPKLCSFWCLQTCNRVTNSACPYRPCNGTFRFPELASQHQDRLSTLVRKLHADGPVSVMRDTSAEMEEIRELLRDSQRGSRTSAIRARYHGTAEDKLAQKYIERSQSMAALTPPEDEGICSLWVGGLPPDAPGMAQIGRQDLHDAFYAYGEISELKVLAERRCAIVTYTLRKAAEEAATALYRKLKIKGVSLKLWWAKSPAAEGGGGGGTGRHGGGGGGGSSYAPPPPGSAPPPGPAGAASMLYPSMNPNMMGARPERG